MVICNTHDVNFECVNENVQQGAENLQQGP